MTLPHQGSPEDDQSEEQDGFVQSVGLHKTGPLTGRPQAWLPAAEEDLEENF